MNADSSDMHDRRISLPDDIQAGLDEFFTVVKIRLLSDPPIEIRFPPGSTLRHWPAEDIDRGNACIFDELENGGNLYAILADAGNCAWTPKYVGTSACRELRKRLREHLVVTKGPDSKLHQVQREVSNGSRIAISYVMIEPGGLRDYMEKRIISEERGLLPGRLSWNKRL